MFDTIFKYDKVLARHQDRPPAEERERYLIVALRCYVAFEIADRAR